MQFIPVYPECTESHIKFHNFFGVMPQDPIHWDAAPSPGREGRERGVGGRGKTGGEGREGMSQMTKLWIGQCHCLLRTENVSGSATVSCVTRSIDDGFEKQMKADEYSNKR